MSMANEPDERDRPEPDADAEPESLWEGVPLELEDLGDGSALSTVAVGEETVERPLAELLPPPGAAPATRWLEHWLLLTGAVAVALALASIGTSLLPDIRPAGWKAALLAFNGAVVVLVVRSLLVAGMPVRRLCHGVFSVSGIAVGAAVALGSLLRSAVRFVHGESLSGLLTDLCVLGMAGLAGCMVFAQCLRGRSWACRTAAVSALVFAILAVLQPFTGSALLAHPGLPLASPGRHWPWLVAVGASGAGYVLARMVLGTRRSPPWASWVIKGGWLIALKGVAVLLAVQLAGEFGRTGAALRLWTAAAAWQAAALLPVLLWGVWTSWRQRGDLQSDICESARFAWSLAALAGMACLVLWLPSSLHTSNLELLLVCAGIFAAIAGAWLADKHGAWMIRWALIPTAGVAVAALCALQDLLDLAHRVGPPRSSVWALGVAYLWCLLAAGLSFAASGLLLMRHRSRTESPEWVLAEDAHLLCFTGMLLSGTGLGVLFALAVGQPAAVAGLKSVLQGATAVVKDLIALGVGVRAADSLAGVWRIVGEGWGGIAAASLSAVLLAIMLVHLVAGSRVRWGLHLVVGLWVPPIGAVLLYALLYGFGLLVPVWQPRLATLPGRFLGSHLFARVLFFALLVGLVARYVEAMRSTALACQPGHGRRLLDRLRAVPADAGPSGGPHLSFLVCLGVLLSASGLAFALVLGLGPHVQATLTQLARLATGCAHMALGFCLLIGRAAGQWHGYAAAATLVLFMLVCVHEECRRGRFGVYPLVGTFWILLLLPLAVLWGSAVRVRPTPPSSGRIPALAIIAVLLVVLFVAAVALLVRWWRGDGPDGEEAGHLPSSQVSWAAHSLGVLGLVLCVVAGAAVLHGALAGNPAYYGQFVRAANTSVLLLEGATARMDALIRALESQGNLTLAAVTVAIASGAVLALHFLARYRITWARTALYVLWFTAALGGAGIVGYMLARQVPGTWPGTQVAIALFLMALVVRTLVALLRRLSTDAQGAAWSTSPEACGLEGGSRPA
jgi:hypothetical protein